METIVITSDDIRKLVNEIGLRPLMAELIDRLTESLRTFDRQQFHTPPRDGFQYEKPNLGLVEWMPILRSGVEATIKVVGYHPENPIKLGLPTILSTISIYDTSNGHLTALLDGTFATALRTGAASAVASSALANPRSSCLGIIGCGAQAVSQLHGLIGLFPLERVLFFDTDPSAMNSYEDRCRCFLDDSELEFFESTIEQIVGQSDILCTATSIQKNEGPLFDEIEFPAHLHVNAVGSDFPGKIELPLSLLRRSFVCPDFLDQAVREGECQQLTESEIGADLVTVIKNPDLYSPLQQEPTVFDSTGWAFEDYVVAQMFMELALELKLATRLEIESTSSDPKDPYAFLTAASDQLVSQR